MRYQMRVWGFCSKVVSECTPRQADARRHDRYVSVTGTMRAFPVCSYTVIVEHGAGAVRCHEGVLRVVSCCTARARPLPSSADMRVLRCGTLGFAWYACCSALCVLRHTALCVACVLHCAACGSVRQYVAVFCAAALCALRDTAAHCLACVLHCAMCGSVRKCVAVFCAAALCAAALCAAALCALRGTAAHCLACVHCEVCCSVLRCCALRSLHGTAAHCLACVHCEVCGSTSQCSALLRTALCVALRHTENVRAALCNVR